MMEMPKKASKSFTRARGDSWLLVGGNEQLFDGGGGDEESS